jgi:hypothetical protein
MGMQMMIFFVRLLDVFKLRAIVREVVQLQQCSRLEQIAERARQLGRGKQASTPIAHRNCHRKGMWTSDASACWSIEIIHLI